MAATPFGSSAVGSIEASYLRKMSRGEALLVSPYVCLCLM